MLSPASLTGRPRPRRRMLRHSVSTSAAANFDWTRPDVPRRAPRGGDLLLFPAAWLRRAGGIPHAVENHTSPKRKGGIELRPSLARRASVNANPARYRKRSQSRDVAAQKKAPGSYGIPWGLRIPVAIRERLDDTRAPHLAGPISPNRCPPQPASRNLGEPPCSVRGSVVRRCAAAGAPDAGPGGLPRLSDGRSVPACPSFAGRTGWG